MAFIINCLLKKLKLIQLIHEKKFKEILAEGRSLRDLIHILEEMEEETYVL